MESERYERDSEDRRRKEHDLRLVLKAERDSEMMKKELDNITFQEMDQKSVEAQVQSFFSVESIERNRQLTNRDSKIEGRINESLQLIISNLQEINRTLLVKKTELEIELKNQEKSFNEQISLKDKEI